jgi:hypothetical protein
MERRSKTLQQMFDDAKEVEDNIQACQRLQNQNLESVANAEKDGVAEEHEIVHKREVDLHPDLFQHEQKIDCSMNFFEVFNDDIVAEDKDHPTEEQVDIPCFFLLDDIAGVHDLPKYDEYDDNYVVDFGVDLLEQPTTCSHPTNVQSQQIYERKQPINHNYAIEHDENCESTERNTLPLCFFLHSNC